MAAKGGSTKPLPSPAPPVASSMATAAPSTHAILISLAALLVTGVLVSTYHNKFRYRLASKGGKRRESIVKNIIAKQEATQAESPTDRSSKTSSASNGRSRSSTLSGGRDPSSLSSACVASTSAVLVNGLSKITTVASGAVASVSSSKGESSASASSSRSGAAISTRDGRGATTAGLQEAAAATGSNNLSLEPSTRKGKGKKGKGTGSSHASSLAASPSASPARRLSKAESTVDVEVPPTFVEVTTQTSFDLPPIHHPSPSSSMPTPTAPLGHFDSHSPHDPNSAVDSASHPSPSTPPKPPPPTTADATVQTSPRLAPRPPPPSLPRPFDLHASFQSTPPQRPHSQSSSTYPHPSPPPSPSPSRSLSALPSAESPRIASRPAPSPSDGPSSSGASRGTSASPSPATSRSRKQARKASAAGATAQQTIVVGMPRPPRSREVTGESERNGEEGFGSPTPSQPKLLRVDTSSSRLSQSPEDSTSALPLSSEKSRGKEREMPGMNGMAMGSGKGRYGIPAPIPIPSTSPHSSPLPSDHRRSSISTNGTSSAHSGTGSSAASPYLSHQILMTMTPPDAGRRTSGVNGLSTKGLSRGEGREEDKYWRSTEEGREKWEQGMMGLAIELNETERQRSGLGEDGGSVGSRRAASNEGSRGGDTGRSWSSTGGSSSPNVPSVSDGYFPSAGPHTALTSPESSPHPPSRQLLPLSSTTRERPWSPQLMAQQYTMIPYPVSGSGNASTPQQQPPHLPHTHSSGGNTSHSRPSSRQASLSVPPNTAQQQQAAHLQQQQAYAFYAHAQAQYQHVIALQLQAQQHHQRQQQAAQQQQQRQRHDSEHSSHSISSTLSKGPPTPSGLVYPISGTSIPPAPPTPQSLSQAQAQSWGAVPPSPGLPPPPPGAHYGGISQSISPTSATFPSSASSSSYSHQHQLPHQQQQQQPGMNAYYLGSPTTAYLSNYSMSPQMPPLGQRQPSSSKRGTGGGRGGGRDEDKLKSPRPGGDRVRSASAAAVTTMSSVSSGPVTDVAGWKVKARAAEMDADRSAKELEIARWRLSVLEEEQRTIELENQEALRALATRAMRAEARIKLLEEARAHDSSSASGSGSPATRPSSIAGSGELPVEMLPPPISFDENDHSTRDSPPGVKVHPLAWLDLDSISFNTRPPTNTARPALHSTPSGNRRKGNRSSGDFGNSNQRRKNMRRRSSNGSTPYGTPTVPTLEDEEEEEVLILLDSPLRRKSVNPPRDSASRRSSLLGDDFSYERDHQQQQHETSSTVDDDELSNLDFEEAESRSARGEPTGTSEYIGFLPTFLKPSSGNTSRPPSTAGSASPRLGPLSVEEDVEAEDAATAGQEEEEDGIRRSFEEEDTLSLAESHADGPDVPLPSFILDRATSDEQPTAVVEQPRAPSPTSSPPPNSVASSDTLGSVGEQTPRAEAPPSPVVEVEVEAEGQDEDRRDEKEDAVVAVGSEEAVGAE